jgi:predicted nucleotide-binding protein (sugar kinase/HSP70/actin superfamily)
LLIIFVTFSNGGTRFASYMYFQNGLFGVKKIVKIPIIAFVGIPALKKQLVVHLLPDCPFSLRKKAF